MELLGVVLYIFVFLSSKIEGLQNGKINDGLKQGALGNDGPRGYFGEDGPRGYYGWDGNRGYQGVDGLPGPEGQKGDKGELGIPGNPGIKGEKGLPGSHDFGSKGKKGKPGICLIGPPGLPGLVGPKGLKGDTGQQGFTGVKGDPGFPGPVGLFGPKGHIGEDGIPGPLGIPGYCVKKNTRTLLSALSKKEKAKILTCKNAFDKNSNMATDDKKVKCSFESRQVCLNYASNDVITYKDSKPFWLSSKDVDFKDIYGLESKQLTWLQKSSVISNLTIRYHCLNSNPNDVTLLSWNDLAIGPEPTATSSTYYVLENDGCSTAPRDKWSFTDIVLVSSTDVTVPIITDFFIQDIENELLRRKKKSLRIEILELCAV